MGGGEGGQRRELNVLKRLRISGALLIVVVSEPHPQQECVDLVMNVLILL